MLVQGLSGKLIGCLLTVLLILSAAGCGGGSSDATGTTPENPIVGNSVLIEARTGPILGVPIGSTAVLDGSDSTIASNSPQFSSTSTGLSYNWAFTSIPEGSTATLADATTANPSFIPDVSGDYLVELVVSANGLSSQRKIQVVVAYGTSERITNHVNLSSNCIQCHSGDVPLNSTEMILGKSATHIASSSLCQSCHTPRDFAIKVKTDHAEVFGNCSLCHDNVTAVGKSEFHSVTDAECDSCHNTTSFLTLEPDGSFDHSTISRSCSGCHNGTVARGKTDSQIHLDNPTVDCIFCHNTLDFKNGYPNHAGPLVVGNRCDSCHNDTGGDGRSSAGFHSEMSVDCAVCHTIYEFKSGGVFDHSVIDISVSPQLPACSECHDDNTSTIGATQKPNDVTHSNLTSDCHVCHTTEDFTASFMDHSIPPVTDFARCDACHGATGTTPPAVDASGLSANHVATNGADCGDCHTPGTFSTGTFDHGTIGAATCTSCHDGNISKGLSSNHIPLATASPADCDVCHNDSVNTYTYTSFATPVNMNHTDAGVDSSVCSVCHDGDKASGKSVGHVPTRSLDCLDCHGDAVGYTDFTLTNWDHAAIPSSDNDCASCHDAGYATAKSATHIPSVAECSVCHTSTSDFISNNFRTAVHDSLTTGCEGCHVAKFFPANTAAYKSNAHLPTTQDCYFCHTASAIDFTTSIFSHQGITSNCASCHDGSVNNEAANAVGEPTDAVHTGIDSDCSICHNTTSWAPQDVDHSRPDVLSVRCDSCHSGNFEPGIPGKNTGHTVTSSDCSVCHNTTTFVGGMVDHSSPQVTSVRCDSCHNGTDATGLSDHPTSHVPTADDCGSCHIAGGTFKPSTFDHAGITNNCESCHNGSFEDSGAQGKNTGHVTTSSDCVACHNTTDFAGAKFNHSTITLSTRCDSCHDGVTSQGKEPPLGHVPTDKDCRECHQTTGFLPATFDHAGITNNCSSCHDAGYATPKSSGHISTSLDCGVCHSGFDSFAGGTFDHSTVSSSTRCDSCHDGNTAKGKDSDPDHLTTTLDCRSCHTTGTFQGGSWTHDSSSAGNCTNCHDNNGGATEQSLGHISTNAQCDWCHSTNNWSYSHSSSDYPGNHNTSRIASNNCTACHTTGLDTGDFPITRLNFPWSERSDLAPYCVACHYNDGRKEHSQSKIEDTGSRGYADCGRSGCHRVSDRNWD